MAFINIWRDEFGAEWTEMHDSRDEAVRDAAQSPRLSRLTGASVYIATIERGKVPTIDLQSDADALNLAIEAEERAVSQTAPSYAGSVPARAA